MWCEWLVVGVGCGGFLLDVKCVDGVVDLVICVYFCFIVGCGDVGNCFDVWLVGM